MLHQGPSCVQTLHLYADSPEKLPNPLLTTNSTPENRGIASADSSKTGPTKPGPATPPLLNVLSSALSEGPKVLGVSNSSVEQGREEAVGNQR